VLVTKETASAALPVRLAATLVETSVKCAAGQSVAGTVPAGVVALAESCLQTMALAKLKTLAASVLLLVGLGIGAVTYATVANRPERAAEPFAEFARGPDLGDRAAGGPVEPAPSPQTAPDVVPAPAAPSVSGTLRSTQVADTRRVILELPAQPRRENQEPRPPESRTYRLRADARILINGMEAAFTDLQPGMEIALELDGDQKTVVSLRATANK
jgi:hypothetical protein